MVGVDRITVHVVSEAVSFDLVGAVVEPVILAGGDAFAVKLKGATYAFMLSEAEGPAECLSWMRVFSNPVADPMEAPPGEGDGSMMI